MKTKLKLIVLACTCKNIIKDELKKKILELTGESNPEIETYDSDCLGILDESGKLCYDFLNIEPGKTRVIITSSDMVIRQINCAIMKGTILREQGKNVYPNIPALDFDAILAFEITKDGKVNELEINKASGFNVPGIDEIIEEINDTMEDLYYNYK